MFPRSIFLVLTVGACQGTSADSHVGSAAPVVTGPSVIEAKDASGKVLARITPAQPCRAVIDGAELSIGTAPIVVQVGTARWSGEVGTNGTQFFHETEKVARMYSQTPDDLALIDPQGIAIIRVSKSTSNPGKYTVADRTGTILRELTPTGAGVSIAGDVTATVTGTVDPLLAAVLTATETSPEIRGLAACHRLFPIEKAPQ